MRAVKFKKLPRISISAPMIALILFPFCVALSAITILVLILELPMVKSNFNILQRQTAAATNTQTSIPIPLTDKHVMAAGVDYTFSGVVDSISSKSITLSDPQMHIPSFLITNYTQFVQAHGTNQFTPAKPSDIQKNSNVTVNVRYDLKTKQWLASSVVLQNSVNDESSQFGD